MPEKIIDCSGFYGVWPAWPVPHSLSVEGPKYLDKYGIDKVVVSSLQSVFYDPEEGNKELLSFASRDERFIPTCVVSPQMGDRALKVLEECSNAGACAVRLYPQHHVYDPDVEPLIAEICGKASELGMPVWFSVRLIMDWSLPVLDVRTITRVAGKFKDTDFVVSGVNYGEFLPMTAAMKKSDNLYLELSCLQVLGGIEKLVQEVGVDKLIFGTGLPLQYPLCNILKVDVAEITGEEKERIFHLNAQKLFNL